MNESDRRQRSISSTPHLMPEDVANRAFGTSFRGLAEHEVRSFLRRVAEELAAARDREGELRAAVERLEEQLRRPPELTEQQLLDALGEETARLLGSARAAAADIRAKAEERAGRAVREAQEEAHRLRTEAEELLDVRTTEADGVVAEMLREAEARATELREATERFVHDLRGRAEREAEVELEAVRAEGRELIGSAQELREQVLADLARRRELLHGQLEELRGGRDRLLESYRVVKRTFLEATEALAQVEARTAVGRPAAGEGAVDAADVSDVASVEARAAAAFAPRAVGEPTTAEPEPPTAEEPAPEGGEEPGEPVAGAPEGGAEPAAGTEPEEPAPGEPVAGAPEGGAEPAAGTEPEEPEEPEEGRPSLADVDSLFARLREGAREAEVEEPASPVAAPGGHEPGPADLAEELVRRDEAVEPLVAATVKAAKRAAQDEQNALLDAVRRHRGRPRSDAVLAAADDQLGEWRAALRDGLDAAYAAGSGSSDVTAAPDELALELVGMLVTPLRERVAAAIDAGGDADDDVAIAERIGARYREWKSESVEAAVVDLLAVGYSRGVYDAAPEGAVLRWVPVEEGRCPDCDDNALEPTVKGAPFPTGQPYPPAHPGCRCLLVVVDDAAAAPPSDDVEERAAAG